MAVRDRTISSDEALVVHVKRSMPQAHEPKPGGKPDIRDEFRALLSNADEWLATPNTRLGGKAPNELIGTADEQKLRDILRGVIYSSMA